MINPGYRRAAAIVKSDTDRQVFTFTQKALLIGTAGSLKVTTAGGDTVEFAQVPAGLFYLQINRVWNTGTSATGLVALGD